MQVYNVSKQYLEEKSKYRIIQKQNFELKERMRGHNCVNIIGKSSVF
jgi:hypothetical protein